MKATKFQYRLILYSGCICLLSLILPGCKKLFGLKLQENQDHITSTIDPHLNKTAWQYLKDRALGPSTVPNDTIFKRMYQGIIYSGIDTMEYLKSNRTYIFLHNDAILRKSGNTTQADCYFGKYKVGSPAVPATKWEDYPQIQVKNYLLSLIADGEYTFETLTPDVTSVQTFEPLGYDPLNPGSLVTFNVINDRDSRLRLNGFPNSALFTTDAAGVITWGLQARTAGLLSTNGPIHVVDRVLFYQKN